MSGPKTATLPQKKTKDTSAEEQPCSSPAACCETIREAAYYKWEAAGCPCGDGTEFWLQAEAELAAKSQSDGSVCQS